MKTLSQSWFAEGYIDFELKKYTLLAYLQEVNAYFNQNKLYPQLADLVFHYNNIKAFQEDKQHLQQLFPKQLTQININRLQMVYEEMMQDDELMQEMESIVQFALDKLKCSIDEGASLYDIVEESLHINPVGLIPLNTYEGYMLITNGNSKAVNIYGYKISLFEKKDASYQSLKTAYLLNMQKKVYTTYEGIKHELIKLFKELPNPGVFYIETPLTYPLDETLLPVAKRSLLRYIRKAAA